MKGEGREGKKKRREGKGRELGEKLKKVYD